MNKIQMVDLVNQYKGIQEEVNEALQDILNNATFIKGKYVQTFENNLAKYLDVKRVISCGNGTDALQIALMALNLQPGDEVITTPFTFVATAEVIVLLKLKPVFVDIEEDTFNIDVEKIEAAITDKTKCIIPVHLFGQACNMEKIMQLSEKHNLFVVEDNAQSLGADYTFSDGRTQKLGTIGDIGCTSFFPSKNLGAYGDGGALYSNNENLTKKIETIANHGSSKRYYYECVGVNSRLDAIQAAILDIKLKHLDKYNESRRDAANYYDAAFENNDLLITPKRVTYSTHVFHQYTLKVNNDKRDELKTFLEDKGIPAMIYYPVPLHESEPYVQCRKVAYKNTKKAGNCVLSLPMHSELSIETLEYITETINNF